MKRLFCPRRANQRCGQKEPIFGTAYSQTPAPRLTERVGPGLSGPVGGISGRGLRPCLSHGPGCPEARTMWKSTGHANGRTVQSSVPYRRPHPRGALVPALCYMSGPISPQNQSRATAPSDSGRQCRACDLDSRGLNSPRKREARTKGRGPQRDRGAGVRLRTARGLVQLATGVNTSRKRIRHGEHWAVHLVRSRVRGRWVLRAGNLDGLSASPDRWTGLVAAGVTGALWVVRAGWRMSGSDPAPAPAPVEILPGASHALKSGTKPPPCRTEWFPVPQTLSGDHGFRYVRKSLAQSPLSHSTFLTLWGQAGHVLGWPVRGASTRRQQMGTLSFLWVVAQRRLCQAPGDKGGPVQRNTGRAVLTGGRPASGAAAPASPAGGTAGPEEPSRRLFVLQPTHPSILASSSVQDPKGRGERTQPGHPRMSL